MRQFFKTTFNKTFNKKFFIGVFGFIFFTVTARIISDLIHHRTEPLHLWILPSFAIIIIMYLIKYIVECIKYLHHRNHEDNGSISEERRVNIGMGLNFLAIFFMLLTLLFLKSGHPWLFLSACLIAVVLRVVVFVKDR